MTSLPKIYVYRPHELHRDCAGVAYDEDGKEIAWHVSSGQGFFRLDMGLAHDPERKGHKHQKYRERYPDGYELEEVIGNWREHPVMKKWGD